MSFKNCVLDGSGLDFGSPGTRFWRAPAPFFLDFRACFLEIIIPLASSLQVASAGFAKRKQFQEAMWHAKLNPPEQKQIDVGVGVSVSVNVVRVDVHVCIDVGRVDVKT